ncbi:MAG: hypothetical protein IJW85_01760, partial [Clostridia bacterium]|nr:hypothetical protein [Clostridia bacterium]
CSAWDVPPSSFKDPTSTGCLHLTAYYNAGKASCKEKNDGETGEIVEGKAFFEGIQAMLWCK